MDNPLGAFLRARRELVSPDEAGLGPVRSVRRVPGLRREEVASLAGISAEYYVRLERGRDRTPSASVVAALAAALQLDPESTDYLMGLAGRRSAAVRDVQVREVPAGLGRLLHRLDVPAMVVNRYSDVLDSTPVARALSAGLIPGINRLRWQFTDPEARRLDPNWEVTAVTGIAHLRAQAGADLHDPRLHALVGELSVRSAAFRRLWARHDVHVASGGTVTIIHPDHGALRFEAEKLLHTGAPGLELLVLQPEARSRTESVLRDLVASRD